MNIRTLAALSAALALAAGWQPDANAGPPDRSQRSESTRFLERFADLIATAAHQSNERTSEALLNTNAPPGQDAPPPPRLNETTPPPSEDVEQRAMEAPRPPTPKRDAARSGRPEADAERGNFDQLDTNGDGRISGAEGRVVADFKANFEMMDADDDGFVTQAEFRARARADNEKEEEPEEQDG